MKKKKKEQVNYLDMIPKRSENIGWKSDETGIVTLEIENKGFFHTIAQKFFKRPRVSQVHLDEMGSFIWPLMDGKRDVYTIAGLVKEHFGDKADPLYPRIAKFFQILESYNFTKLEKKEK